MLRAKNGGMKRLVRCRAFGAMRSITFRLPATQARELKVWAHTVTPDGTSESLPAIAEICCGNDTKRFDLRLSGGQIVLPMTAGECSLRIAFRGRMPDERLRRDLKSAALYERDKNPALR